MAISALNNNVNVSKNADGSYSYSTGFDINSFYKLLAAQISNPSMESNEDTTDSYINQMLQLATMESMSSMVNSTNTQTQLINSNFAAGLVGQEVTVVEVDSKGNPLTYKDENGETQLQTKTGVVTGVSLYGDPMIFVDGKSYYLSQLMDVGNTAVKDEDTGSSDNNGGTEGGAADKSKGMGV